jgi:hypothetical protein
MFLLVWFNSHEKNNHFLVLINNDYLHVCFITLFMFTNLSKVNMIDSYQ